MASPALLASTATTAAKNVPAVTADCATTSWASASVQLASVDAGTQLTPLAGTRLNYAQKAFVNFFTSTWKMGQTLA